MSGEHRPLLDGYDNVDISAEPSAAANNYVSANPPSSYQVSTPTHESQSVIPNQIANSSNNARNLPNDRRRGPPQSNEQSRSRRARQRRRNQLCVKPSPNSFPNDREFEGLIRRAEEAIELGIYPERII